MHAVTNPTQYTSPETCLLSFEWAATDEGYKITLEGETIAEVSFKNTLSKKAKTPSLDKIQTAAEAFIEGIRRGVTTLQVKVKINSILGMEYFNLDKKI